MLKTVSLLLNMGLAHTRKALYYGATSPGGYEMSGCTKTDMRTETDNTSHCHALATGLLGIWAVLSLSPDSPIN
jgi:hypothetical protein